MSRSMLWRSAIACGLLWAPWAISCRHAPDSSTATEAATRYHCPMHPTYTADQPGACPICHMDLVPIRSETTPETEPAQGHQDDRLAVSLSPTGIERSGIRTEVVKREAVSTLLRTVGTVVADETRIHHLHIKVSGYVEALFVAFEGQFVSAGEPILSLYSPELLATQEEYLRALDAARRFAAHDTRELQQASADLVAAARRKLLLLDVPAELINAIEADRQARREVMIGARHSGFVTAKDVYVGMQIEPGRELFSISDLSHVWVEAEIFEVDTQHVRPNLAATVRLAYDPTALWYGRVAYVAPTFQQESRTLRVRFDVPNPKLALKPGMFADVEFQLEPHDGLTIDAQAVIDTGTRQLVYRQRAPGEFEPVEVRTHIRQDGRAEVLSGLAEGDRIVVDGTFLLDSESRLRHGVLRGSTQSSEHQGHAP